MKITVTFKDPDGVHESIRDAVEATIPEDITDVDEQAALIDKRVEKINAALETWIEYSEYLSVEFDTEAKTATVVRVLP